MRLEERVKTHDGFENWEQLVKTVRYKGKTRNTMTQEELDWCMSHLGPPRHSIHVRIMNDFAFIFKIGDRKRHKLITVISIPDPPPEYVKIRKQYSYEHTEYRKLSSETT